MSRGSRFAALLTLLLLGSSCRADAPDATQTRSASPRFETDFWNVWGDGRGEVSGYDLVQPRYGPERTGTAVLIFVTETFADGLRVKSDPGRRPASEEFPVMKLNTVEDFSTGIYDYNLLISTFVALAPRHGRPAGAPTKVSFSSQEWCGNVYAQALFDSTAVRFTLHSYFDGEADQSRSIDGAGLFSEDALKLWARGLAWPVVASGDSTQVSMLPSLKASRLLHRPLEPLTATLAVHPGMTSITVPGGTFAVETRTATLSDGRSWNFDVEAAPPHRLIRWRGSDGEQGSYLAGERLSYWTMNGPGLESELKRLGLSPRPPRTP
jgi:hypothetical protein